MLQVTLTGDTTSGRYERLMDLSIIVVNWNTRDLLAQCLQSIYDTTSDLDFGVIVVDNASTDGSQEMVRREFPDVSLIANTENLGFVKANNQAIRTSRGRCVLLLNSDTIVMPGALQSMVAFMDKHEKAGIVGCKLLNADRSLQPSWASFPTLWSELRGKNFRHRRRTEGQDRAYEVDWVGGACLLARRKAVEMVGLLDEDFFMYSEETDWCFRMVRSGWKVYHLPDAEVIHFGGGSSQRASDEMLVQLYQSKLRFFHKHYGLFREQLLRALLIITSLAKGWGLAVLSLLRKTDPNQHSYRRHLMLARELLCGQRTELEH